jgi:hypothetical protein
MTSRTKQKAAERKKQGKVIKRALNHFTREARAAKRVASAAPPVHVEKPAKAPRAASERKKLARAGERWAKRGPTARVPTGPDTSVLVSVNRRERLKMAAQQRAHAAVLRLVANRAAAKAKCAEDRERAGALRSEVVDG